MRPDLVVRIGPFVAVYFAVLLLDTSRAPLGFSVGRLEVQLVFGFTGPSIGLISARGVGGTCIPNPYYEWARYYRGRPYGY